MQGRGGAGFPTGTKWGFLPADVFPRYVVVNGDESEPGTYKDRILMERDPHQLIEGILLTCYAVKAAQAFLYVRGEMALAQERLAQALNDAYADNLVGKDILGTGFDVDITLTWGAGAYIVGEETALIESLEGERGMPRLKPPFFPAAKGLYLQPTIVNNVETLSNVPWIIAEGGAAFRDLGAPTSTGMRMFAVSGHVNRPGVFEVPNGVTTFRELFDAPEYCDGIRDGRKLKAFIPGGVSAPWFFEEHLDLPLDKPTVDKAGSMLGSGAIVVMDETTDIVKAALADRALLRPRVVRQVHPVPRGHDVAGAHPRPHPRGQRAAGGPRPAARRVRQHQPRRPVAAPPDDHLPARPVGRLADHVGAPPLPRRVRGTTSSTDVPSTASSTTSRSMSDADTGGSARQDHGLHHGRRPGDRGPPGRVGDRRLRARRRLHPAVLLPPPDGLGRHVPAVPGRDRHRRGADARRVAA